jgi:very-short-patch-repair endonuclease
MNWRREYNKLFPLPCGERVKVRGIWRISEVQIKRQNIDKCRSLRKNQTDAERKLWGALRNRQLMGAKFRRQFPVGAYVLDFYSPEYKLAIEADGGQHYEDEGKQRDEIRRIELSKLGIELLRFGDQEILSNLEGVCESILKTVNRKMNVPPHLDPLPQGERNS